MGEFTKVELLILEKCTEAIDSFIYAITSAQSDKDRMLYSSYLNDNEKDNFTKSEIKKMQKKLAKCNPDIAEYIRCYISPSEFDLSGDNLDQYRHRLILNFLIQEFEDVLEVLLTKFKSAKDVEDVYELFWEEIIDDGHYGIDNKFMKHFVKYMAIAERLSTFKSILESVEEEKKKPKIDVILDKMKAEVKERESKKINDELSATLDNLRGQHISSLQLYKIIKDKTNLEKDALEYLKDDIGWYLWSMKTAQECFYSEEETERAYKKIEEKYTKEKQLELGYLKKTKTFLDFEYEDPEELIYINKEKLLFPNEFTSIEELITIIDKELNKLETVSVDNKSDNAKTDMYSRLNNEVNEEVLLVEELEKRLAIEAVEYRKNCDDYWETYTFDPTYFDTFISGPLYNEFLKSIYDRIKPLNDFEINKYLTLSVNQFKTHTPTKRAEAFNRVYHDTYWHPNYMEYKPNQYENKYAMHVWKHYANHFHLFKEATESVLQDFKNGLIGGGSSSKQEPNYESQNVKAKNLNQKQVINNITKDIVEIINSINNFELILFPKSEKSGIKLSSEEIQNQYATYTDKIKTYINEIYIDGDIAYLKRLLLTVNEYVAKWKTINSSDDYYLDIATQNEKYRGLVETIDVAYIIDTKLLFLKEIQHNLERQIFKTEPKKPKAKSKSRYHSFTYIDNLTGQSNLTALKDSLIRKKLIAKETDLKDFRKVFSGEAISKPIVWTGKISELTYFIKQLHNNLKYVENVKQEIWAVTINCFIQEKGEHYNRTKLRTQKVPATSKNIDSALKTLK